MEKLAKNRSKDLVQQKLRDNKDVWNKSCSEFIARVIAFKRGLNGRGDAKYSIPPSNIKDPFPPQIGSALSQLVSDFNSLSSEATRIIEEQSQYSKTRRKKQKSAMVAEASNIFTRSFAYFTSFFSRNEYKAYRMSMLKQCADLVVNLRDFEDTLYDKKIDHYPELWKMFQGIKYRASNISESYNRLVSNFNNKIDNSNNVENLESSVKNKEVKLKHKKININDIKKDLQDFPLLGLSSEKVNTKDLISLIKSFDNETNESRKDLILDRIFEVYHNLIESIRSEIQSETGKILPESSIEGFAESYENIKTASHEIYIDKLAGNFVSRWFNKMLYELSPNDPTAAAKLDMRKSIIETKAILNEMMDSLEKKIDGQVLNSTIKQLSDKMHDMSKIMNILSTFYKEVSYLQNHKKIKDKPVIDNIIDRKINRNIFRDLSNE